MKMFKWLKEVFNPVPEGELEFKCNVPMPKVKPCKSEKNISEPVISFVECVKNNPKRFKIDQDYMFSGRVYTIKDTESNIEFRAIQVHHYYSEDSYIPSGYMGGMDLTDKEVAYACVAIEKFYSARYKRYKEIKDLRARRKFTKIYKETV